MPILRLGDLDLWIAGPMASASKRMPNSGIPVTGGWNRCVLTVDSLSQKVASLNEDGATFRNDILEGPGGKQILCRDPSGNAVKLFFEPT